MSTGYLIPPATRDHWQDSHYLLSSTDTRGNEGVAIVAVFAVTSLVAVAVRIRACIHIKSFKLGDKLVLLYLALSLAFYALFCAGALCFHTNHHTWDLTDDQLVVSLKASPCARLATRSPRLTRS